MFFLSKRAGFDFLVIFKLLKIIRDNNIDIVNAHHFMPLFYSFFACKLSRHTKLVYTEHSVWEAERLVGLWKSAARLIFGWTDAMVAVSPEIMEYLINKYRIKRRQICTIINGVDADRFKPGNKPEKSDTDKNGTVTIGMVGNFKHVKNHAILIKAFRDIVIDFPYCRLWFVGQGFPNDPENTEEEIRNIVSRYGIADKVRFLGYREDVHTLLQSMDIFCLPSLREGLPLSIIEAMATGLPVVGTNVDGIRVVVKSDRNGFLVDSNNQAELAHALAQLVADSSLRKRMGRVAREDVEKYYSLKKCIERYSLLFESLTC
jgi:glycosyltransferase involved in cell wall biosynthesis